jgi:dihydrofolate reductase
VAKILLDLSMSLDGFAAGSNVSVESPMGEGGERLHEWLFQSAPNEIDAQIAKEMHSTTGAVVLGRRTFDVGVGVWEDTPYPVPCFVLTHEPLERRVEKSGTFTFVTDVENACRLASAAAGEKDVRLMGAEVSQSFLRAGLVDEIRIQLVPVLMGDGRRLFDDLGTERIELERADVIESPHVTHLRFRVVK